MNVKPLHNTRSLQSARSGLMQTKHLRREPIQIRSRIVAREFKSGDRPDLYAGTPPLEALKATISIAGCPQETFSIMHIDVSRAYFHVQAQRLVLIRLPVEDRMGADAGEIGQLKKSMYGTGDAASNWERDWQEHVKSWRYQLGLSSKKMFSQQRNQVTGITHGDDFVLTGPTERLTEFENEMTGVYPIEAKLICYGSTESIKALNRRLHWGKRGTMYQHDPRHVDVLVKDFGLEQGNSVQTPAAHDVTEEEPELLDQVQHSKYRSQVGRCLFFSQDRVKLTYIEECQNPHNRALPS